MGQFSNQKAHSIITPLRILNKLLQEESSVIVTTIISKISVDLISYIIYFYKVEKPEKDKLNKLKDEAKNLF
jgi:hypothetical protein